MKEPRIAKTLRHLWIMGGTDHGIGNITLIVPEAVGVRVRVAGGVGAVEESDLAVLASPEDEDGTVYVNTAYATSPVTLDLVAERGIDNVSLLTQAPALEPEAP